MRLGLALGSTDRPAREGLCTLACELWGEQAGHRFSEDDFQLHPWVPRGLGALGDPSQLIAGLGGARRCPPVMVGVPLQKSRDCRPLVESRPLFPELVCRALFPSPHPCHTSEKVGSKWGRHRAFIKPLLFTPFSQFAVIFIIKIIRKEKNGHINETQSYQLWGGGGLPCPPGLFVRHCRVFSRRLRVEPVNGRSPALREIRARKSQGLHFTDAGTRRGHQPLFSPCPLVLNGAGGRC